MKPYWPLGAGVIVQHEAKHRVQGLMTAASIWAAAGHGAASGLGLYRLVALALAMALFSFSREALLKLRSRSASGIEGGFAFFTSSAV